MKAIEHFALQASYILSLSLFSSLIKRLTNMNSEHLPEHKEHQDSLLEP